MLITETQTVKQFSDESEFESTLSFSLEKSDVEDWVVVENDAQELSLSLANWKKLVEMGNKIIIPIENSKSEKGILDNLNSKQLDELEIILKKNRKLYSEEEVLAFGKSCFYKGFEKSEKDDANCYTAFREEIGSLVEQFKNK